MKKVGILTITHGQNYGNRLQNYAVQTVLERQGVRAETIRNTTKTFNTRSTKYRIKLLIKRMTGYKLEQIDIRRYKFDKFTDKYIHLSKYVVSEGNIPHNLSTAYDMFVSGSDQVWNPHYGCNSCIDFMTFVDKNKRMSYAASFGITKLPSELREQYRIWINELKYISVREDTGAEIVRELTGRDATVLIDPTLMLDAYEWERLEKQPFNINKETSYVLVYFLGGLENQVEQYIKRVADEIDSEIIYLYSDYDERGNGRENTSFSYDPSEFLWLIHHAKIIFTDSFHACVFSMLYNKPFRVFERNDKEILEMGSRISNLLKIFRLNRCKGALDETTDEILSLKYNIEDVLQQQRKKTQYFLETALQK